MQSIGQNLKGKLVVAVKKFPAMILKVKAFLKLFLRFGKYPSRHLPLSGSFPHFLTALSVLADGTEQQY
jgi:hypothetical protein